MQEASESGFSLVSLHFLTEVKAPCHDGEQKSRYFLLSQLVPVAKEPHSADEGTRVGQRVVLPETSFLQIPNAPLTSAKTSESLPPTAFGLSLSLKSLENVPMNGFSHILLVFWPPGSWDTSQLLLAHSSSSICCHPGHFVGRASSHISHLVHAIFS